MTVLERLERAATACPDTFTVHATRGQALLTEVAQRGSYTVTDDGIVAFSGFALADVEEAKRFAAPHLSHEEFLQQLHLYATTLVGGGFFDGKTYRLYLHEHAWRVRLMEEDKVQATYEMDDDALASWLRRARASHAA